MFVTLRTACDFYNRKFIPIGNVLKCPLLRTYWKWVDMINWCPIFKWIAVAWLKWVDDKTEIQATATRWHILLHRICPMNIHTVLSRFISLGLCIISSKRSVWFIPHNLQGYFTGIGCPGRKKEVGISYHRGNRMIVPVIANANAQCRNPEGCGWHRPVIGIEKT